MPDFAIITTGGKQYKVTPGQKIQVEKLGPAEGAASFKVLLRSANGKVEIGMPHLAGAAEGRLVRAVRGEKKITFKYHSKTRRRRKKGHRQDYAEVEIVKI
ncbi:MAG TPA: 50S ribosomal protein L21 [Candidatus Paceibacterota bacterium]|nr:50S ribosomal protein L21 [Candidatus Paceibacterota bacterium]